MFEDKNSPRISKLTPRKDNYHPCPLEERLQFPFSHNKNLKRKITKENYRTAGNITIFFRFHFFCIANQLSLVLALVNPLFLKSFFLQKHLLVAAASFFYLSIHSFLYNVVVVQLPQEQKGVIKNPHANKLLLQYDQVFLLHQMGLDRRFQRRRARRELSCWKTE